MDFIYVCRQGENEELRYSIRSVLASFPDATIWVVGAKPNWYGGKFIEVRKEPNKYATVEKNLKVICKSQSISEQFVLMNDDFFITEKIDSIETYHAGKLSDMIGRLEEAYRKSNGEMDRSYLNRIQRTFNFIKRKYNILEPVNYELHMPMVMEKSRLEPLVELPSLWRSTYGNVYNIGGIESGDVKVYEHDSYESFDYINGPGPYASSDDSSFDRMKPWLHSLFPNPSKYELDM